MYIKRLELLGFKTFAEKTAIDMSDGITAIVGPNGSGKSNIADALLWVLGESNVRNLRGQRATDVIFSGSEKRKALGMADVALTLDNSCGTLPLDFNEVTVTRRAYRSGEGEYFINKTRCRLKDIYELFLDTGIGREAYSFVTQGEIDAVLSAKAEDRRELFEEAAGIKKYRYRREEAVRKLERTDANLRRVCDIMSEISGQLEPLAEQAEQAKRFNELQSRLWDIEIGLLIRDLKRFTAQLAEIRDSKRGAGERIEEYDIRLVDLDVQKEKLGEQLARLEEQLDDARRVHQSLSTNVQRLDSKGALIQERMKTADSTRQHAGDDISGLERKIKEAEDRIGRLEAEEKVGVESESTARTAVTDATSRIDELQARFEEASRLVNSRKADFLELAKELAAKRNALQNSQERVAQLGAAITKREQEITDLESQVEEAKSRGEEASKAAESAKARIAELEAQVAKLVAERQAASKQSSDLRTKHAGVSRDIAARASRLGALKEMAEAHEGFFEGVRNVMAARKAGKIKGSFAVVADVLTVPEGYEIAIETALAASVQDIISDTIDQAKDAIAFLKENRAGRATFLPLDGIRRSPHEVAGGSKRDRGFLGIASDRVRFDPKYTPAIESLLRRTVIAETIDDAVALSRTLDGWNKIVTLEGELIVPSGAISGGVNKGRGPALLVRKQEIDALDREVKSLQSELGRVEKECAEVESRLSDLNASIQSAEGSTGEAKAALTEQRRRGDFAAQDSQRIGKQLSLVRLEREESGNLLTSEAANVTRLEQELSQAGRENTDLDEQVSGAEQDIERLQQELAAARAELMRLNVELASCVERNTGVRNSLRAVTTAVDELKLSLATRTSQLDGAATEIDALSAEATAVSDEVTKQRELLCAAEKNLNTLTTSRAEVSHSAADVDSQLREVSAARNRLADETHEAAVREARLEVQINQISERLLQEYELGYEQAMEWPEEEIEIERGAVGEVARLRREIKEMGPVNTGAVQEYERIKERWDFLTEQRTDLESAKSQVNEAIHEIDLNTRSLFMDTFNAAASNFDLMFKRLFGGGTTRITLTDPNDLLETGVDVAVQPPGKKMQDMALLSGGERALTATALIFSLLMIKPSPFVVMDEVDAPLDESNVERFAEVVKEFSKDSQFIVVTHNRATMEAAKSLYGVTMQEPGVSKVISVRLSAEGPVAREAATVGAQTTTV